jgi:Protein of unknown function (DUF3738)
MAYGLRDYQFEGPGWLHTARYNIVATTASPQPRSIQLAMLRSLLTDRFRLAIRHESKIVPRSPQTETNFSTVPTSAGATELHGYGGLGRLSDFLTRLVERSVIDRPASPATSISVSNARSTDIPATTPAQGSSTPRNPNWA